MNYERGVKRGVFRVAHPHTPFLGQCPPKLQFGSIHRVYNHGYYKVYLFFLFLFFSFLFSFFKFVVHWCIHLIFHFMLFFPYCCRMTRATFQSITDELRPHIEKQNTNMRRSIAADHRVAITLWRLATNIEYRTLAHLFGVGRSTFCVIVHETCKAIGGASHAATDICSRGSSSAGTEKTCVSSTLA